MPPLNEADTCRKLVVLALQSAGRDDDPHSIAEQRTITDGRIDPANHSQQRSGALRIRQPQTSAGAHPQCVASEPK